MPTSSQVTPLRRESLLLLSTVALLASCTSGAGNRSIPARSTPPATSPTSSTVPKPAAGGSAAAWITYGRDAARSGLDPTSPPVTNPRPAWTSVPLDGSVYAQPLVVGSSVIAATENDTVYSLDITTGNINWSRHLANPVRGASLPCGNIDPSGITGTPVADLAAQALWVVTFSSPPAHTLWELDLGNGLVLGSRPADPPGTDAATEQQRGALALDSGKVYIPYGGLYGDCGSYHGWVVGLSESSPADGTILTYETPAELAGIWAPPGPVVEGNGNLLVATGNGLPANVAGDANSVIELEPSLRVIHRFTAPDYQHLSQTDTDFGSISPVVVAGGKVFQAGKEGVGYVLPPTLGSPLQTLHVCGGAFGAAAVAGDNVYLSCLDGLFALTITPAGRASSRWAVTGIKPGPPIVAGGAVWTIDRDGSLFGFSEASGTKVYSHPVSVAGSFPTLSSYSGRLFAADGDRVMAFSGV
jgi:outer membrane protein assembly factor BamB